MESGQNYRVARRRGKPNGLQFSGMASSSFFTVFMGKTFTKERRNRMRNTIICILMSIVVVGCQEPVREAPELHGSWEETWMMVMDNSPDMTDEMFDMLIVDSTNWEKKMRMKPVRTTYYADGTFRGEFRNLKDSIYVYSGGKWEVRGDSLYFMQFEPDTFLATYWYEVRDDTLHTKGVIDWSRNGEANDKFAATQKKIE
jgi:hypothetical protein